MDIAGLVKGASEGQGLGNSFLSHIGACDGIFHLCRKYATICRRYPCSTFPRFVFIINIVLMFRVDMHNACK